jgi:hypothetical protein
MIPEPQDADALFGQIFQPPFVMLSAIRGVVLSPIEFHGKSKFMAVEVQHVRFQHMLASKLLTSKPAVAKHRPYQLFGVGLLLAKLAGEAQKFGW